MSTSKMTRRAFRATATTTATLSLAAAAAQNTAKVVPGKRSPNKKLNCAAIGGGGKGSSGIGACRKENVVALCDVDWDRGARGFEYFPKAKRYRDYKNMLEEMPEIDAVTISTPAHTHCKRRSKSAAELVAD